MNKIAIVTGSEGGIGKAIIEVLKEIGFKVKGIDIKNEQDICNKYQMKDILSHYDKIDCLVNCAGIAFKKENNNKIIKINLIAPYELSRLVFPKMKKKGGNIINITSLWSERGFKNNPYYGMSKGGLKMLTKCLAIEWAEYNIRVNNIGLGYFKTNMTKYSWENRREKITDRIPLGRWGEPNDIKEAIKFLINCEYITGQDLYLDGGWLCNGGLK